MRAPSPGSYPFVGIDLTAGARPSDLAALGAGGQRVALAAARTDDEIIALLEGWGAVIVAIDSPLGYPAGLCCLEASCACAPLHPGTGRSAERALARRGIPCFWTTKRTIIKRMIYRAIPLGERLAAAGYRVLEVFPYASKRILLGRSLPRKGRPEGRTRALEGLRRLVPGCQWPAAPALPSHDQLDALYAALTGLLYARGGTEALGDEGEVPIIVPRGPAGPPR